MLTYEDFTLGREFVLGPKTVTADEIIAFAKKYDPQSFHTDPNSDQAKEVGGLIASGWHTSSLFMRMIYDSYLKDSTSQGSAGLDSVRWKRPVRPGDTLTGTARVVGRRVSKSRPELGFVDFAYELKNQNDEVVMLVEGAGIIKTGEAG